MSEYINEKLLEDYPTYISIEQKKQYIRTIRKLYMQNIYE